MSRSTWRDDLRLLKAAAVFTVIVLALAAAADWLLP